ncbi:MAG: HlyD family efflux transporter periplasmic adaptor subunit [Planctomycetaceae bacterium]|nr:HlyD family efflux transporter periplasmic adaptor subunit [Planctomycetaceae bacterium]
MKAHSQRAILIMVALAVVAAVVLAMLPAPVAVDVSTICRGPLVVTISDDGRTRIRERYIVSAPLSGRLVRIQLKPGDPVVAHETQLTAIEPADPSLLDPRAVAEAEARVKAADARLGQAKPRLESARIALNHAETELGRIQQLFDRNAGAKQELDTQRVIFQQAGNEYESAKFEVEIARFELDVAKAAMTRGSDDSGRHEWSFPVTSPISGRVLRVFQESATVLNAGERILEIGEPTDLEVEVDVLSRDAVRIRPGNRVMLEQWGGGVSLAARVRLIEPSAFTKVSALGLEEQRVNVIIDFVEPPDKRPPLGDGYRVEAAIVEWESTDVLTVPTGALFRDGDSWAVFVAAGNRARLTRVELGHRNDNEAEVLRGLKEGDRVILYPGDRVEDRTRIEER